MSEDSLPFLLRIVVIIMVRRKKKNDAKKRLSHTQAASTRKALQKLFDNVCAQQEFVSSGGGTVPRQQFQPWLSFSLIRGMQNLKSQS